MFWGEMHHLPIVGSVVAESFESQPGNSEGKMETLKRHRIGSLIVFLGVMTVIAS